MLNAVLSDFKCKPLHEEHLADLGVRVHCLALGGVDLTSSSGKMTMQVIAAVAEFERDLLIDRTQAQERQVSVLVVLPL